MTDRLNKTSICSIVFLDIIDYSKKPVSEQVDDKTFFNLLINEAIQNVAPNDRIILDTGDGAAITLTGAPEEALFIALTIRDGILKHNIDNPLPLLVRIGINLGSIRVVQDLNDRPNIIGDGINVAQRIMSFADANQILVSRSYYEVTSRLTKEITSMFTYSGVKQDKHIREHEVYVIKSKDEPGPISAPERDVYTIGGVKVPGSKFASIYFVPIVVAGLFMALMVWYLMVLRPIPFSGKEYEEVTSSAPVALKRPEPTSVNKAVDKSETPIATSTPINDENKTQIPIPAPSEVKQKAKVAAKSIAKPTSKTITQPNVKQQQIAITLEKKETPVEHHNESSPPSAETKANHQKVLGTEPVLKHVCTQAEIVMNQCK